MTDAMVGALVDAMVDDYPPWVVTGAQAPFFT